MANEKQPAEDAADSVMRILYALGGIALIVGVFFGGWKISEQQERKRERELEETARAERARDSARGPAQSEKSLAPGLTEAAKNLVDKVEEDIRRGNEKNKQRK